MELTFVVVAWKNKNTGFKGLKRKGFFRIIDVIEEMKEFLLQEWIIDSITSRIC